MFLGFFSSADCLLWHCKQHACLGIHVQNFLGSSCFPGIGLFYSQSWTEVIWRTLAGFQLHRKWEVTQQWNHPSKLNIEIRRPPDLEVGNNNPVRVVLSLGVPTQFFDVSETSQDYCTKPEGRVTSSSEQESSWFLG